MSANSVPAPRLRHASSAIPHRTDAGFVGPLASENSLPPQPLDPDV